MINYDKIPNIKIKDLEQIDKYRYRRGAFLDLTLAKFCDLFLFTYRRTNLRNITKGQDEFAYNYVLPYLIECGAIVPMLSDPITNGLIPLPNLERIGRDDRVAGFPRNREDVPTVGYLLELFFGDGKEDLRKHAHLNSINQRQSMQRLFNYISKCEEIDAEYLGSVYTIMQKCGVFDNDVNNQSCEFGTENESVQS